MYVCAWGNTVYIVLLALFCKQWISRPGSRCWGAPGTRLWCWGQGMRLLSTRVGVYVPRQGYLGVVWRLVYVANCRLLVSTNWNVSRLSTVAGWWSHVGSRVKCALKQRTLCRWVCGAVNHSFKTHWAMSWAYSLHCSRSYPSLYITFNDPSWGWFGIWEWDWSPSPILFPWQLSIIGFLTSLLFPCFQVDMGAVPATLVNFVSKRQPLAIAYLRDYLVSTSLHISSKESLPS